MPSSNLKLSQILVLCCSFLSNHYMMQSMKKENQELRKTIQSILEEIERQKDLNAQHQTEIETLLKFNERLLSIIQNQLSNKKDNCSLQPISERSQRESDLLGGNLNALISSIKLVAKSQKGFNTRNSLVERVRSSNTKLNDLFKEKEALKSELDKSYDNEDFSERKLQFKTTSGAGQPPRHPVEPAACVKAEGVSKTLEHSKLVKEEMSQEIAELKKFKNQGAKFYESKIKEVKGLASKLGGFKPGEQLKHITEKLALSQSTSQLLKKTLQKGQARK